MAVRRRRPLIPPPYPRRNRYTPLSSGQTALHSLPPCGETSQRSVAPPLSARNSFAWFLAELSTLGFGKLRFTRFYLAAKVRRVLDAEITVWNCNILPDGSMLQFREI